MRIRYLYSFFYSGLLLLTAGSIFRIQHWPSGTMYQAIGLLLQLVFFILLLVEVVSSKKASGLLKAALMAAYIIVPGCAYYLLEALPLIAVLLISGGIYLVIFRRKVLFSNQELINKDLFDSI